MSSWQCYIEIVLFYTGTDWTVFQLSFCLNSDYHRSVRKNWAHISRSLFRSGISDSQDFKRAIEHACYWGSRKISDIRLLNSWETNFSLWQAEGALLLVFLYRVWKEIVCVLEIVIIVRNYSKKREYQEFLPSLFLFGAWVTSDFCLFWICTNQTTLIVPSA